MSDDTHTQQKKAPLAPGQRVQLGNGELATVRRVARHGVFVLTDAGQNLLATEEECAAVAGAPAQKREGGDTISVPLHLWQDMIEEFEDHLANWPAWRDRILAEVKVGALLSRPLGGECDECHGRGDDAEDSSKDCYVCGGSGVVPQPSAPDPRDADQVEPMRSAREIAASHGFPPCSTLCETTHTCTTCNAVRGAVQAAINERDAKIARLRGEVERHIAIARDVETAAERLDRACATPERVAEDTRVVGGFVSGLNLVATEVEIMDRSARIVVQQRADLRERDDIKAQLAAEKEETARFAKLYQDEEIARCRLKAALARIQNETLAAFAGIEMSTMSDLREQIIARDVALKEVPGILRMICNKYPGIDGIDGLLEEMLAALEKAGE